MKGGRLSIALLAGIALGVLGAASPAIARSSQSADFFYGVFRVTQPPDGRPITVLRLIERLVCGPLRIAHASGAGASRSHAHGLWGSGRGNFRTVGNHGAATVQGTIWWSRDRCDGTLFRVKRGVVAVHDFGRHRTVRIGAGHRYLAAAG